MRWAGRWARQLRSVAALSRLGADPRRAWAEAPPELAALGRVLVRAGESGATVAGSLRTLAAESRATARAATQAAVQRAGVWVLAPLGACFLPAFVCLGVAPLVLGIAGGRLRLTVGAGRRTRPAPAVRTAGAPRRRRRRTRRRPSRTAVMSPVRRASAICRWNSPVRSAGRVCQVTTASTAPGLRIWCTLPAGTSRVSPARRVVSTPSTRHHISPSRTVKCSLWFGWRCAIGSAESGR